MVIIDGNFTVDARKSWRPYIHLRNLGETLQACEISRPGNRWFTSSAAREAQVEPGAFEEACSQCPGRWGRVRAGHARGGVGWGGSVFVSTNRVAYDSGLFSHTPGATSLKSRCRQGRFLLEALREGVIHVSFLASGGHRQGLASLRL